MERGLRAPLSTREEIALQRVANGVGEVDPRQVERLAQLDLIQRDRTPLRLTETGMRRLGILPATLPGGG
ncbi:MAG: hypothetical protein U1E23_12090 [Reyranellaceae bacterium]